MRAFDESDGEFCLRVVGDNALLVAKLNLVDERYIVLHKADGYKFMDGEVSHHSTRVKQLVEGEWVYPTEAQQYLHVYDINRLRNSFYGDAHHETNYFRELCCGEYVLVSIDIFSGKDCSPEDPWVFLVIKRVNASLSANFYQEAEYYYSREPLTKLWNRGKYEKDIDRLSRVEDQTLGCLYVDAVGLHELNNHLGHKAGDQMLCAVADTLRKYFPGDFIYRIGGDEFVVLCQDGCHGDEHIKDAVAAMKEELQSEDYEISAGWAFAKNGVGLRTAILQAEDAMRVDKTAYYQTNGKQRQSRMMNTKLENMLLEKQDASEFLSIISTRFKGVYIVDMKLDRCRYIYIPPYFQEILDRRQNAYLPSLKEYMESLVQPKYYEEFTEICDYDYIKKELAEGRPVRLEYQKKNNDWVRLSVFPCYQEGKSLHTTIWIFSDMKDEKAVSPMAWLAGKKLSCFF